MIKLSIKNLASFALDDYCPRCEWFKNKMGYRYPFSIFPGVFSTIDAHAKKVVNFYYEKKGKLPEPLETLFPGYKPVKAPHWTKMKLNLGELETRGSTDMLLQKGQNIVVLDNKTSHFKDADDDLAPLYDFQLNACGKALEANGHGKVDSMHLVYWDPVKLEKEDVVPIIALDGDNPSYSPYLRFEILLREVTKDTDLINRVVSRACSVLSSPIPPKGNEGCRNCEAIDKLLEAASHMPGA